MLVHHALLPAAGSCSKFGRGPLNQMPTDLCFSCLSALLQSMAPSVVCRRQQLQKRFQTHVLTPELAQTQRSLPRAQDSSTADFGSILLDDLGHVDQLLLSAGGAEIQLGLGNRQQAQTAALATATSFQLPPARVNTGTLWSRTSKRTAATSDARKCDQRKLVVELPENHAVRFPPACVCMKGTSTT